MFRLRRRPGRCAGVCLATLIAGLGLTAQPANAAPVGGTQLWQATYTGAGGTNGAAAMAVSPDGSTVFVTGESQSKPGDNNLDDYVTAAYSTATGAEIWLARYDGAPDSADFPVGLVLSPDGSKVFVTGSSDSGTGLYFDYATVAYDASNGTQLWVKRYNDRFGFTDFAKSIAANPNGSAVYVTGWTPSRDGTNTDCLTFAYDATTGKRLWKARYGRARGPYPGAWCRSVAASPDGTRVFVAGGSRSRSGNAEDFTVAYDAGTGRRDWVASHGPAGTNISPTVVRASPDGSRVFVIEADGTIVGYAAATGAQLWTATNEHGMTPTGMVVGPLGRSVSVTGSGPGGLGTDSKYMTIKYLAGTGQEQWFQTYQGPAGAWDGASAIAVAPDGSAVYVTGASQRVPYGPEDYATVAYSVSGSFLWASRFSGPASSGACCVAVGPQGDKLFVTGTIGLNGGVSEYGTLAYGAQ